jgi:hypothetical protein
MTLVIEGRDGVWSNLVNQVAIKTFRLRKRVFQKFNPAKVSTPVFIVGSGRSGTDIVTHTLSRSFFTAIYNEYHDAAFENWRLRPLDEIGGLIEKSSAQFVVFKPIVETLRSKELLDYFPDGKLLFAVRDYRDAVNSMVRFFGRGHIKAVQAWVRSDFERHSQAPEYMKDFIRTHCDENVSLQDACALYWLLYNAAYQYLDLENDPRARLISYERLVRNSNEETRDLASFLGISWSSGMTQGIYDKSIGKSSPPNISPAIEAECNRVWEYLSKCIQSER